MARLVFVLSAAAVLVACATGGPSTYTPGISNQGGRWLTVAELPAGSRQALEEQLRGKLGGLQSCTRQGGTAEVAAYFVRLNLAADGRHEGGLVLPRGNPNAAPGVEVCVRNRVRGWHFDPIEMPGAGVSVMIPLRLDGDAYDMSRDLM